MSGSHRTEKPRAGADNAPARSTSDPFDRTDPPVFALTLTPYRSMSIPAFRGVLIFTAIGLSIPLLPFLGTPVGWALLPFLVGALVALYLAVVRNYRDAALREDLRLWPDLITVVRTEARGAGVQRWHANPYWTTVRLHDDAKLESYLTLKGNGREIELGAFLSPQEREDIHAQIAAALAALDRNSG